MTNHPGVGAGASPLLEMYAIWYQVEIAPVCSGASLGASRLVLGKMQIIASTRTSSHEIISTTLYVCKSKMYWNFHILVDNLFEIQ